MRTADIGNVIRIEKLQRSKETLGELIDAYVAKPGDKELLAKALAAAPAAQVNDNKVYRVCDARIALAAMEKNRPDREALQHRAEKAIEAFGAFKAKMADGERKISAQYPDPKSSLSNIQGQWDILHTEHRHESRALVEKRDAAMKSLKDAQIFFAEFNRLSGEAKL